MTLTDFHGLKIHCLTNIFEFKINECFILFGEIHTCAETTLGSSITECLMTVQNEELKN